MSLGWPLRPIWWWKWWTLELNCSYGVFQLPYILGYLRYFMGHTETKPSTFTFPLYFITVALLTKSSSATTSSSGQSPPTPRCRPTLAAWTWSPWTSSAGVTTACRRTLCGGSTAASPARRPSKSSLGSSMKFRGPGLIRFTGKIDQYFFYVHTYSTLGFKKG